MLKNDGKVKFIGRVANSQKNNVSFDYDAFGRRTAKHVLTSSNDLLSSTYYILDAQGNVMTTYEMNIDTVNSSLSFYQAEKYIYGSSRLGMLKDSVNVLGSAFGNTDSSNVIHTLGNKRYELSNHLGNVLTVITDKPIPHDDGSGNADYWLADIKSSQDYSPFGVMLTGRTFEKIDSVPVTTTEIVPIAKDSVMVSVEDYIHYTDFEKAVHTTSSALSVTFSNYHGWTNWSNSTLSTEYRSGSNWLKINSTVGSGGANKYLLLQPSTQYRLTFTADRASVANFVVVAATISSTNSLNIFATKTVSTNGAQTFTFTTPASLPMNVVMLQLRQSGTYYIDNYSVTKVSGSLIMDFGNFEIGAYASNTVMDYYDDWYNRANLPIAIAQGNWMNRIRVNYGDPYDCLRKVISVTPNQQYTFRGKIVGAQNGNVRVMQMSSSTPSSMSLVTYQLISTNDGYVEFSFTPTKNQVQITVNGVGTYYLEDVAVFKTITQKKYTPTTHEQVLPTFTNVQNMTQTGATVQSTSGSGAKGGQSVEQVNKGDYIEFEIGSDALSNYYNGAVGLSHTPSGKNIEMDFSWYLGLPAMTRDVLVAGVYKPNLNNPRLFQNGDVYRIWRNNGNVEFYVNGLLDGTFPDKYPDRPMYLEAVFYDVNKKVENLYIYKEVLKTHDTIQTTEMVAKKDGYKWGFQGQEQDEETGLVNYTYRMHNPRLGRFFAVDPLFREYPHNSTYAFSENDPLNYIELEGKEKSPDKAQLEQAKKDNKAIISTYDAKLALIAARGVSDALTNANTLGLYDLFGGDHLDEYESLEEQIAYVRGRVVGDAMSFLQAISEIEAGGGTIVGGLATGGVVSIGGAAVVAHGAAVATAAGVDYIENQSKLYRLEARKQSSSYKNTKHTDNRHIDRSKYPEKSKYSKPAQKEKLQDKTINNYDKKTVQKDGRVVYEKDMNRKIGTKGETNHKVVIDEKKQKIVTSYPQKKQ